MAVNRAETRIPQLAQIQRIALIVGGVALVASVLGALLSGTTQFFQSYLFAYLYWMLPTFGSLGLLMLQYLTGGRWGQTLRRFFEAGAANFALMAVLFLPLLLGLSELYPWARPEVVAENEIVAHRTPYLNVPFFLGRTVLYFIVWGGLTYLLRSWSMQQDRTNNPSFTRRLGTLSGPGIVAFVLTLSFAAFDWGMSTEEVWFSTIYGVIFLVSSGLVTFSLSSIMLALLRRTQPLARIASPGRFHDIGSLMFAFTVLWAYVGFSQFLITWSANLVEEVTFYVHRTKGGWEWIAYSLMAFQFALPFLVLLSRRTKRSPQRLPIIAALILVMQTVYIFWNIAPSFHTEQFSISWLDFVSWLAIGGLWLGLYAWWLQRRPLVAPNDPRMPSMLNPRHEDSFEHEMRKSHA
jgi:hypothetical protein